ncbi:uncharacterized protein SCHCODRAFT_01136655 [Schizophyllum commune H4-8]|nr:uncharacterized protein SCHCODRAFT_01136655 [Schizophyllum commune H4-8]KAI5886300.1 hypothetical protein SCHCODRAFT_01136655 [Schizophyllum commune H4-8]
MDPPPFDAFLASMQMVGSTVRTLLLYLYSVQHSIADKLGFVHPSEPTELDQVAAFAIPFIRYVQTLYDAVPKDTIPDLNAVPELLYILWPVVVAILITASMTLFGPHRFTLHSSTIYVLLIAAIPIVCNLEVDGNYQHIFSDHFVPSWALVSRLWQGWDCVIPPDDVAHFAVRFLLLAVGAQIGMVLHTIAVWLYFTVRIAFAVVRSVFCLPFKLFPALRGAIKPHLRQPECPSPIAPAEELAAPVDGLVAPVDELATLEERTAPAEEPPAPVNQQAVCPDELDCGEDERVPADQLSSASPDIAANSAKEEEPVSVEMDANPSPPSPPLPPASDDSVSERSEHSSTTLNRPLTVSEDRPENAEALDSEPNKSEVSQPDAVEEKPAQTFDVAYTVPSAVYAVPFIDYAAFDPANSSEQVCLEDDHNLLSQNDQTDDEQKIADVPPSTSPLEASTPVTSELGTDAPTTLTPARVYVEKTPVPTSQPSDADAAPPTSPLFEEEEEEEEDEMPELQCLTHTHPYHVPLSDPRIRADIDTMMNALDPTVSDDVREFLSSVSSDYFRFGFLAALMTRMDAHPEQIKRNFELLDDDGDSDDEDEPLASWQQGYHLGDHHAYTFIFAQHERPRDPSPLEVEQTIRALTHKIIWQIYTQSDIYTGWDDFEDPCQWGAHRYRGVEPWCMDVDDCRAFVRNGCDMGARDLKVFERAVLFSVLHHDVPFVRLPRSQGAPFVDPHVWEVVHMYVRLMADSEVYSRMLEKVVNFLNGVTRKWIILCGIGCRCYARSCSPSYNRQSLDGDGLSLSSSLHSAFSRAQPFDIAVIACLGCHAIVEHPLIVVVFTFYSAIVAFFVDACAFSPPRASSYPVISTSSLSETATPEASASSAPASCTLPAAVEPPTSRGDESSPEELCTSLVNAPPPAGSGLST